MWCLNKLETEKERCPNCRAPYNQENYRIVQESDDFSYSKQSDSSISLEKRKVSFYFSLFI